MYRFMHAWMKINFGSLSFTFHGKLKWITLSLMTYCFLLEAVKMMLFVSPSIHSLFFMWSCQKLTLTSSSPQLSSLSLSQNVLTSALLSSMTCLIQKVAMYIYVQCGVLTLYMCINTGISCGQFCAGDLHAIEFYFLR